VSPHPVATPGFRYDAGRLACAGVDLSRLADALGTPCYVYDAEGVRGRYRSLTGALAPLAPLVRYAVKANPNLAVVRLLSGLGAGMDVVSLGELERAWLGGAAMGDICFAGVAKGDAELRAALDGRHSPLLHERRLTRGRDVAARGPIGLINAESASEIERVDAIARELGVVANATIRLNPGVSAGANDKVRVGEGASKFGLPPEDVLALARRCGELPGVRFRGLHMHLGSQIADLARLDEALGAVVELADRLDAAGRPVDVLNVGAGVAVSYMGEPAPSDAAWAETLARRLGPRVEGGATVMVEPGRELVAQAGVLLTRVRHVKRAGTRTIVTTDAGLNALVRPAMYGAAHMVWPAVCPPDAAPDPIAPPDGRGLARADVVGPVCESSDVFARDRPIPPVERGDVLAVFTAGAYGMSMAMTFNDLPMPAEVMVDAGVARVVREPQGYADLLAPTALGLAGGREIGGL
jgi:diaminopimelate decarboxylase